MLRIGYDAEAFLGPNGGLGKGLQLRNLLGPRTTFEAPRNRLRVLHWWRGVLRRLYRPGRAW